MFRIDINAFRQGARSTQRRGDERRNQLLRALQRLLEKQDMKELTYAAVCTEAGLPSGSARHFYPDLGTLLCALAIEFGKQHDAALTRPFRARDLRSWRILLRCLIDRSARFNRANPVYAKLTISAGTPSELKGLDRDADRVRAQLVLGILEEHFVLPRIPKREKVVYFAVEIVDLAFTLSVREAGHLTIEWVQHGKDAAEAYMAKHFGDELESRPTSPGADSRKRTQR
jgi:AcrR family transcriptional regulator